VPGEVRVSLELIKPVALALCLLSIWAVFQVVFFSPELELEDMGWRAVVLLAMAAGIAVSSGMIFLPEGARGLGNCLRTLPVQLFCWGVGVIAVMFVAARYCEAHCIIVKNACRI